MEAEPFLSPTAFGALREAAERADLHRRDLERLQERFPELFAAQITAGPFNHGDALPGDPVVLFATVTSSGNQIALEFSENVTGTTGFTLTASGGPVTVTYVSGSGGTSYVFSTSRPILPTETVTIAYAGGNILDTTSTALAPFSGLSVTNDGSAPPTVTLAGGRYSWKERQFTKDGVRYDGSGDLTGGPLWMPAYDPNNATITPPFECWLKQKLSTDTRGPEFEIIGGGGGGSTTAANNPFFWTLPTATLSVPPLSLYTVANPIFTLPAAGLYHVSGTFTCSWASDLSATFGPFEVRHYLKFSSEMANGLIFGPDFADAVAPPTAWTTQVSATWLVKTSEPNLAMKYVVLPIISGTTTLQNGLLPLRGLTIITAVRLW